MMTQIEIAKYFKAKHDSKISQAKISLLLNGKEAVSWPFACSLAAEFHWMDVQGWKNATPDQLREAFASLRAEEVA
jgi:hypothetical protein